MTRIPDEHLSEDALIEYALHGRDEVHTEHIESCPSCSRYVKEIRAIKRTLQSLPDEDIPEKIRKAILTSVKGKDLYLDEWSQFEVTTWYKNPLVVGLGIIGTVIFLYIFFVFIL